MYEVEQEFMPTNRNLISWLDSQSNMYAVAKHMYCNGIAAGLRHIKPPNTVQLWHNRLNHPGETLMMKLNTQYNLKITTKGIKSFYSTFACIGCIAAKIQANSKRKVKYHMIIGIKIKTHKQ